MIHSWCPEERLVERPSYLETAGHSGAGAQSFLVGHMWYLLCCYPYRYSPFFAGYGWCSRTPDNSSFGQKYPKKWTVAALWKSILSSITCKLLFRSRVNPPFGGFRFVIGVPPVIIHFWDFPWTKPSIQLLGYPHGETETNASPVSGWWGADGLAGEMDTRGDLGRDSGADHHRLSLASRLYFRGMMILEQGKAPSNDYFSCFQVSISVLDWDDLGVEFALEGQNLLRQEGRDCSPEIAGIWRSGWWFGRLLCFHILEIIYLWTNPL